MSCTILEKLQSDPQVELGTLVNNKHFLTFLTRLPEILTDVIEKTLTVRSLMETQHLSLQGLLEMTEISQGILVQLTNSLSEYQNAEVFLEVLGITEEEYCMQVPGMTEEEFATMQAGNMTVGDLLTQHPAVVLAPLFRQRMH